MELFRAGEALLRYSQPLLPFLAPAVYHRPHTPARVPAASQQHLTRPLQCRARRRFSTSVSCRQEAAAAARQEPASNGNTSLSDEFDRILNIPRSSGPSYRTSRTLSPTTKQPNIPSRAPVRGKSSVEDIMDALVPSQNKKASPSSSNDPLGIYGVGGLGLFGPPAVEEPATPRESPLKLNSTVGRMVQVNAARGMDVGRAFRTLEMTCNRNRVKQDFLSQRFHERPGLKRKRLKSQRWQKKFKDAFKDTILKVRRLKAQGW